MERRHLADVASLQRECFPAPFPEELLWTPAHLDNHLELFPEGQFVALWEGRVAGSASSLLVAREDYERHGSWESLTGGLSLDGHRPHGTILFGADISVAPWARGRGAARALYAARFSLVRRLGLEMYATVCRLPGFGASGAESPAEYAAQTAAGQRADAVLTPLLRMGLAFCGIIEEHMDDPESGNAAAILEWRP